MKIKVIDLLNKIANGEQPPKKIYYLEETFTYDEQDKDYYDSETYGLFDRYEIPPILNDEVEILETTITYKQDDKDLIEENIMLKNENLELRNKLYNQDNIENNKQDNKIKYLYLVNIHTTDTFNLCEHTNEQLEQVNNKINELIDKVNKL